MTEKEYLDKVHYLMGNMPKEIDNAETLEKCLKLETSSKGRKRSSVVMMLHRRYMTHYREQDRKYWLDKCQKG